MIIRVANEGWGGARAADVNAVVQSAATGILRHCTRLAGEELVLQCRVIEDSPIVFYRDTGKGPYIVSVTTRGPFWSQLAYQFAHELCHVISGFERLRKNPNNWFHEALCELASIYALCEMSHSWQREPPYPNWKSYADSLWTYAARVLDRPEHHLPCDTSLGAWVARNEAELRRTANNRQLNGLVAKALFPHFTETPSGWDALQYMPPANGSLQEFLVAWHQEAPDRARPFVASICEAFGV